MLSFSTEFPVEKQYEVGDFSNAVRRWIVGSPHTTFADADLRDMSCTDTWSASKPQEHVESMGSSTTDNELACVRYRKSSNGLDWETHVVFSRTSHDAWVGIRVSCESPHPAIRLPPARKPLIVRTILDSLKGGADGPLWVRDTARRLEDYEIDLAARLISGDAGCHLPIVYVSATFHGGLDVDVDSLARQLSGMAHVVVEPNRAFSLRLKPEVRSKNVYGGVIGIYWPGGGGSRAYPASARIQSANLIEIDITDEIRVALTNRRPLGRCTLAAVQEANSRRVVQSLRDAGSQEVEQFVQAFDKELAAKDDRLAAADREIDRLNAELRKYEARNPLGAGLAILTGTEQDLYAGEMLSIVHDALKDQLTKVGTDSRRKHVLESVVNANEVNGEAAELRSQLKEILRGYRSMDSKIRNALIEMGFAISEDGKHHKVVFRGDDRYTFILPKTGSDYRGGLNAAGDISRLLF